MKKLVLLRHGQSTWNLENRFTGWKDVDLTEQGVEEAKTAGQKLSEGRLDFDRVFTSVLKRAIRTMFCTLDEMDRLWLPVERAWQLNERHYGALQGLDKSETAAEHGEEQVQIWRRSFDTPPPMMDLDDERHPRHDRRYAHLNPEEVPSGESLKETIARVVPYWKSVIAPAVQKERVLIVAHGNSLRALVKHLDQISNEEIMKLNIPTGVPLVYELDDQLRPLKNYYLEDQAALAEKMNAVANQGKASQ